MVCAALSKAQGSLTVQQAADRMQQASSAVEALIRNDELLAVKVDGELRLPIAQFDYISEPDRLDVLPGIRGVLALFAIESVGEDRHVDALLFLTHRHPGLGRTPMEALRNRRAQRVLRLLQAHLEFDQLVAEASQFVARLEADGYPEAPAKDYIFAKAVHVFGSAVAAIDWLHTAALALGRDRPIIHLDTVEGRRRLQTLLIQLEYSVYI